MDPFNKEDIKMYFYENRLKTFEGWPFDEGCSCTPENVSKGVKWLTFATVSTTTVSPKTRKPLIFERNTL